MWHEFWSRETTLGLHLLDSEGSFSLIQTFWRITLKTWREEGAGYSSEISSSYSAGICFSYVIHGACEMWFWLGLGNPYRERRWWVIERGTGGCGGFLWMQIATSLQGEGNTCTVSLYLSPGSQAKICELDLGLPSNWDSPFSSIELSPFGPQSKWFMART